MDKDPSPQFKALDLPRITFTKYSAYRIDGENLNE